MEKQTLQIFYSDAPENSMNAINKIISEITLNHLFKNVNFLCAMKVSHVIFLNTYDS